GENGITGLLVRIGEALPCVSRLRKLRRVEPERGERPLAVSLLEKVVGEGIQGVLSEVVGPPCRESLLELVVFRQGRGRSGFPERLAQLLLERHRPGPPP